MPITDRDLQRATDAAIAAENADPKGLPADDLAALGSYKRRTYRLITVAEAPFDAFPPYSEGGPAKVTNTEYSVSTSSLCGVLSSPEVVQRDDRKHTLNLSRRVPGLPLSDPGAYEKHPLDGTKYATQRDADRAAYEAGALAFMVYDDSRWADVVPQPE